MKQFLIIINSAPFTNANIKEGLDMALILAAFDQKVNLLLQGDALFALKTEQTTEQLNIKNYLKSLGTLSLYDIEHIYICHGSMQELGLTSDNFAYDVIALNHQQKQHLINQQTQVVTL